MDEKGLDKKEVARQLFPNNNFPVRALDRAIKGDYALDANQISKLALLANATIGELFSGESWKSDYDGRLHTFTNGEFMATLDPTTWMTRVFHNKSLFHETIIHSKEVPLGEYFEKLNQIINTKK